MKPFFIALSLACTLPVLAQENKPDTERQPGNTELEEVIIQGNRLQVPFSQITRDIQVITQEQIQQLPATSINEVLTYISGVDIRQRGPFGTQADVSIDGGTSEQVLVLINGVKMLDAQTAHNMMNIPIPLSAIAHIEVLRGAAARVYGINALTGAINIVTKKARNSFVSAGIHAGSSFKSKEAEDGQGIYGGGGLDFTGNFGSASQNHLLSVAQSNYNGQRYNSASENTRLFYQGGYDFDESHSIQAMAGYARSLFGANGFYAAPGDLNSEELVKSSVFSLSSKHQLGNFTLSPRISDRYGEDDYRYYKDDLSKGRSMHYTNALMLELNGALETSIGTLGLGWESRLEKINSSNIGEHERNNHGAYGELRTGLGEKLIGTLGLYANYNTDYDWQVYPGIDVAYLINKRWKLSASMGSGQRIPSFTDLYLNQLPANVGNEFLRSENVWNYEGNIQYKTKLLRVQGGYFFRNIDNFIDWVRQEEEEPYSPINFGNNKMQGVYGRFRQHIPLGNQQSFAYRISYNYLHPTLETQEGAQSKYILESLKHQFIVGANYQIKNLSIGVENRLLKRELAEAYNITDIRINYQWEKLLIYTKITNLFDATYTEAGAVPMPTRWFGLGLQYQWNPGEF